MPAPLCVHDSVAQTLATAEALDRPSALTFQQLQHAVSPQHRALLVDWLIDCVEELGLRSETLFLAVDLLDRHLSAQVESTQWLQLLGAACVWTASKVEGVGVPSSEAIVTLTDNTFTVTQLAWMERRLLQAVQHGVVRPTIHTFLATLLHISQAEEVFGGVPADCSVRCSLCYWELCEEACVPPTAAQAVAAQLQRPHGPAGMAPWQPSASLSSRLSSHTHATGGQHAEGWARDRQHMCVPPLRSISQFSGASSGLSHGTVACMEQLDSSWHARWESSLDQGTIMCMPADMDDAAACGGHGAQHAAALLQQQVPLGLPPAQLLAERTPLEYLARLIAECCLLDHQLLDFLPSKVAAASVMLARAMLGMPAWTPTLAQHSGVGGPLEQAECLLMVADAYAHARYDSQLLALHHRYGSRRLDVVSLPPSPEAVQLVATCRAALLGPALIPMMAPHSLPCPPAGAGAHAALDTWQFDALSGGMVCDVTPELLAGGAPADAAAVAAPVPALASSLTDSVAQQLVSCSLHDGVDAAGTTGATSAPSVAHRTSSSSMQLPCKLNPFLDSEPLPHAGHLSSISASHVISQPAMLGCSSTGMHCPDVRVISCPGMACVHVASLSLASAACSGPEDVCGTLAYDQLRCLSETPAAMNSLLRAAGGDTAGPSAQQPISMSTLYDMFLDDAHAQQQ